MAALLALTGAAVVAALALTRGGGGPPRPSAATRAPREQPPPPPTPTGPSLAIGLTESNPALVWSAASGVDVGAFARWRDRLAALRPRYLRVLVDWSHLQPRADRPPDLAQGADGCQRGIPPCRPYAGLRELFAAAASQQRAGGGFEVVLTIYGVPAWAGRPPSGCERSDAGARSRPITDAGLADYRALIRALLALGRREGVTLRWWAPWNEPNGPFFLSPQRATCDASAPSRAAAVYARLFRAARDELRADGGDHRLILGDLADVVSRKPLSTAAAEFVGDLPGDVICDAAVAGQHAYAEPGRTATVVGALERALDARRCGRELAIWITETGAGGAHAGSHRTGGAAGARADCRALDAALRRWWRDPRVTAAFQYTFRDDPAFPVGLADAGLTRTWPTAGVLAAWGGDRAPAAAPPPPPACASS